MEPQHLRRLLEEIRTRHYKDYAAAWSVFNTWYSQAHPSARNDADAIGCIKGYDSEHPFRRAFCSLIETHHSPHYPLIREQLESSLRAVHAEPALTLGFVDHGLDNVVMRLVREFWINPNIGGLVYCGQGKPTQGMRRQITTVYVDMSLYRHLYSKASEVAAQLQNISRPTRSVQEILREIGIESIGSCCYLIGNEVPRTQEAGVLMNEMVGTNLERLLNIQRDQDLFHGFFADVVEILYAVRNFTVHGYLDPSNLQNDRLFQSAYECLFDLLNEYLKLPNPG